MRDSRSLDGFVVLVVEDDADALQTVGWVIGDILGCSVLKASSGDQALRIMDGARVDLVLTDVVMPKMDGLTLTDVIHERYPTLPVVLTTGLAIAPDTARKRRTSVLMKPYGVDELVAMIREQLLADQPGRITDQPGRITDQPARITSAVWTVPPSVPARVNRVRDSIARGEVIVVRQRGLVRHLQEAGSDSTLAAWMLKTFEESLIVMRRRLAVAELETAA